MLQLPGRLIILFVLVACTVSCSGYSITGGPGSTVPAHTQVEDSIGSKALLAVHSVYVAPVTFAAGINETESTDQILARILQRNVENALDFEVLGGEADVERYRGTNRQIMAGHAREKARELGADGVILTHVQQYVERVGTSVAADQGARVAVEMELVRVDTAQVIWKASHVFKDEALSENILRIGERLKEVKNDGRRGWWTARELFDRGSAELAQALQSERLRQFSKLR